MYVKKQATLLIINLEKIYTMDSVNKHPLVFQHAFIAIHHERILAVGCGSWQEYADKDTRILDGRGHIAVPGFIEVAAQLSAASTRDGLRRQLEEGMAYMRNGTLTLACGGGGAPSLCEQPCFEILDAAADGIAVLYPYADLFGKAAGACTAFVSVLPASMRFRISCVRHSCWGWQRSMMHGRCCRH